MKKRTRIIVALAVAFLCCLHSVFTGKLYFSSDNFEISLILNGYYSSPLSQYQHLLLCLAIFFTSQVLPFVDDFLLFLHCSVLLELAVMFYLLAENPMKKKLSKWKATDILSFAFALLSVIFLSAGFKIWYVNYTITSGSLVAVGMLTLCIAKHREKRKIWIAIGTILIAFGFMLRKESGLLFLPFCLLFIIVGLIQAIDWRVEIRKLKKYFLPAFAVVTLLLLSQAILNTFEPYASAKRYNNARTAIMDYPMESWSTVESKGTELFKTDYDAAINWLFTDTEVMDTDLLEEIASEGSKKKYEFSTDGFSHVLSEMWTTAGKTDVFLSLAILLILLLTIWNAVSGASFWYVLASLLTPVGGFLILAYFTFIGRAPLRVWEPVLFATLITELVIMMQARSRWPEIAHTVLLLLLSVALYYGAGQVIAHTEFNAPEFALTSRINSDDSVYESTTEADDLYIWPNWGATVPKHAQDTGKLPSRDVIDHNIAIGYWTTGQPYYTAFLERIGHPNPIRDLVEKDNVYIMSNSTYIHSFLREHYGEDINLVEAGKVNGTLAYRVERGNTDE